MPATKSKPTLRTNDVPAVVGNVNEYIGHTVEIDPNDIMDTPNVRATPTDPDEVLDNLASMKREQWQNVLIEPNPAAQNGDARFRIVDGRRRLLFAKIQRNGDSKRNVKANPDFRIRAHIVPNAEGKGNAQALASLMKAYAVNAEAQQMTPLDQAHTYQVLRTQFKLDDSAARKAMGGFSPTWSHVLTKLAKASDRIKEALTNGDIDSWTAADMSVLTEDAQQRVFDAIEKVNRDRKRAMTEAQRDPSEIQKEADEKQRQADARRAAKEAAKEEKAKAKLAKQAKTGKEDGRGKGSKSGEKKARTSAEVKAAFSELMGVKNLPSQIGKFVMVMGEFIRSDCQHNKLYKALWEIAGLEPESAPTLGDVQKEAATATTTTGSNTGSTAKGSATAAAKAKMQAATVKA